MLVLSRTLNESLIIDENVLVTVAYFRGDSVGLRAQFRNGELPPIDFMLQLDERRNITPEISISLVALRGDKLQLGVDAPKNSSVHRKEVYDAIKKRPGDDDNPADSRVPRPIVPPSNSAAAELEIPRDEDQQ